MNENDLGKALLRGEDPIDLHAITHCVLRRDRRRMWGLGVLCVFAWMLVVALPWSTTLPMLAKIGQHQLELSQNVSPTPAEQQEWAFHMAQGFKGSIVAAFISSMVAMFVAAVCTVALIILSRRATLRQVNARLADISHQLRTLTSTPK